MNNTQLRPLCALDTISCIWGHVGSLESWVCWHGSACIPLSIMYLSSLFTFLLSFSLLFLLSPRLLHYLLILALFRHRPGCARAPCNRPALYPGPDWPILRRRGYYYPSLIYFHSIHPIMPPIQLHHVFALSLVLRPSA